MTDAALINAIREAVREELRQHMPDEWLSADDVARMLDVKRSSIPHYVTREGLPCYRPGKGYTFKRSEVEAWLESRRNKPTGSVHTLRRVKG